MMAGVLLVEGFPGAGYGLEQSLRCLGHGVVRCAGGRVASGGCDLLKSGNCPLVDFANVIVFWKGPWGRFVGWTHGCLDVLNQYRIHPRYGRIPTILVGFDDSENAGGWGPVVRVKSFDDKAILDAVLTFIGPRRKRADAALT
jgi:hypothetical protein